MPDADRREAGGEVGRVVRADQLGRSCVRGLDRTDLHLNLASCPDGRELVGKQRLAQRSYRYESESSFGESRRKVVAMSPSLVASGERLWLAWTGSNGALNVLAADRGGSSAPMALQQRSARSPSLTTAADGAVVLAWTGSDTRLNIARLGWSPAGGGGLGAATI